MQLINKYLPHFVTALIETIKLEFKFKNLPLFSLYMDVPIFLGWID